MSTNSYSKTRRNLGGFAALCLLAGCAADMEVGPGGVGAGPGAAADPRGRDGSCQRIEVGANPGETPTVHIVLDKSGSMRFSGLWPEAVAAVEGLTSRLDDQVAFGLTMFPDFRSTGGAFPGLPGGAMPTIEEVCKHGEPALPLSVGNAAEIRSALRQTVADGNTPTAATLDAVRRFGTGPDQVPPVVLLVTDGAPNCGVGRPAECVCTADLRPGQACPDHLCVDPAAVESVAQMASEGIRTYVVGFRTSRWTETLDAMARAGGTDRDRHILAESQAELEAALADITGSILSCSYELDAAPFDPTYVRVTVDGEDVSHESLSEARGWRLSGEKTVELLGDACTQLRNIDQSHRVEIVVECEQQTPF